MGRRLYWQDSYGRIHRDRDAAKGRAPGLGWTGKVLSVLAFLALIMVIASVLAQL